MKEVRRKTAEYYIYAGTSLLLLDLGLFLLFKRVNIAMTSSGTAAVVLIFVGIERMKNSSNCIEERSIDREYYMMKGMIPGYVQNKYIKTKTWFIYSALFAVSLIMAIVGTVGVSIHPAGHQLDIDFVISLFGWTLFLYVEALSLLIVNEYCNSLGLPHGGGPFEAKIKRTKLSVWILNLCFFPIFVVFIAALYYLA